MKNLVLGFAEGYDVPEIEIFVRSLRETDFNGDAAIFVDRWASKRVETFLDDQGVQTIRVGLKRSIGKKLCGIAGLCRQFAGTDRDPSGFVDDYFFQHPTAARWTYCRNFLELANDSYEHVILSDVRDVVFQCDPFVHAHGHDICLFSEPGPVLEESGSTAKWLRRSYGDDVLRQVGQCPVVCAGAVTGTHQGMVTLIDGLIEVMSMAKAYWAMRFGLDQAALNYLVYADVGGFLSKNDVRIFPDGSGSIVNLALAKTKELNGSDLHSVKDSQGRLIPVLHQYDRHRILREQAEQQFRRAA